MGLLGGRRGGEGEGPETPEPQLAAQAEAEIEQSLARIEQGGIPLGAERRLSELRERGGLFTSDLSVNGWALCHQLGLRPISQVMGSSIYQVGYQQSTWPMMMGGTVLTELDTLSSAWNEVRRRALNRLAQEAQHAGADAVVGVELRTGAHDFAEGAIEYVVFGTAVRREGATPHGQGAAASAPAPTGAAAHSKGAAAHHGQAERRGPPVLTELSVADYSKLVRAGIEPVGIVAWSSVFFASLAFGNLVGLPLASGRLMAPAQNFELQDFTRAFYSAREQVMERMGAQAEQLGASGVVGVRIAHSAQPHTVRGGSMQFGSSERSGLMMTFHAIGTAIRQQENAPLYPPEPTIDLTT
jgi:uncharacterized protein YbjQ (UPF0145 family)